MKNKSLEALSIVNALMLAMFIGASPNKTLMYRFNGTFFIRYQVFVLPSVSEFNCFVRGVWSRSPTFLIGRRCLNEIFVMNLVQYVEFVSNAANVYEVTTAIHAVHQIGGKGEVSDRGDHSSLAHLLDVSRRLKDFPLSTAPGSGFCLRTTFVGFVSQEKRLTIFPWNRSLIRYFIN